MPVLSITHKEAVLRLKKAFEDLGFVIRKNPYKQREGDEKWTATHTERGVKFTVMTTSSKKEYRSFGTHANKTGWPSGVDEWYHSIDIQVHVKSELNTWRKAKSPFRERWIRWTDLKGNEKVDIPEEDLKGIRRYRIAGQLDETIQDIPKFVGATLEERRKKDKTEDLYDPLTFEESTIQEFSSGHGRSHGRRFTIKHFLHTVEVLGFARIEPNLRVTDRAEVPDSECWFHLSCSTNYNGSGASPHMLVKIKSDKLVYYPVIKAGPHWRISKTLQPEGTYIDFSACTQIDEKLIRHAIEDFLSGV